ncbi:MAG: protease modulator HflK [Verrucomicrobia bacterium]|nr:protease modulator HflK [Verrucomicrobiota bacterium]
MPEPTPILKPTPAPADDAGTQALSEALHSSFKIVKLLMALLVVVFLGTGLFTVQPNEVAVVLRFGRPLGTGTEALLKPGIHWAFPAPIDKVVLIPVGQSHKVVSTAGWFATTPELEATGKEPAPRPSLQPGADGYALTGDGNIIHVRATLNYRITPATALDYQFDFTNATELVQHVLDSALFHAAAQFTADQALYRDTARFKEVLLARVQQQVDALKLGITLEPSEVKVSAPLAVRPAFEAVQSAAQDRGKKISEARGQADQLTRKAVGEANAIVSAGVTASNQVVQSVAADANYFLAQLPSYRKDPAMFEQRLLTETMQRVLTNAQDKFVLPVPGENQRRELRLQLNREPQKAATQQDQINREPIRP